MISDQLHMTFRIGGREFAYSLREPFATSVLRAIRDQERSNVERWGELNEYVEWALEEPKAWSSNNSGARSPGEA